jgi:hypothetical protein
MVLVKDNRPKAHRKLFAVYFKCPEKVISEHKSVIYTKDLLGRVRKHSKNNVKQAGIRTAAMFNSLPDDIKALLGDTFNSDNWDQILTNKEIPQYFLDVAPDVEVGPVLRNQIPKDTHLIEQEMRSDVSVNTNDENDEDVDLESNLMVQLNDLHKHEKLSSPNITLKDIPNLHNKLRKELLEAELNESLDTGPLREQDNVLIAPSTTDIIESTSEIAQDAQETGPLNADILLSNILPKGSKRVRFAFPKFQMPSFFKKK